MKLGMQVGLGPGHTVLDGDPAGHNTPSQTGQDRQTGQTDNGLIA